MKDTFPKNAVSFNAAVIPMLCLGLFVGVTPAPGMDLVVDPGVNTFWAAGDWGQSFTALDGDIGRVGLLLWNSGAATNATLKLYEGQGTGGTVLQSQSLAVPNSSNGSWVDMDVSSLAFSTASTYTIGLTDGGSTSAKVCSTNSYGGGTGYYGSSPISNYDLSFRVAPPVPEPSAMLLLGLGLVGLIGHRPLRKQSS